jgi:hypothetical protein
MSPPQADYRLGASFDDDVSRARGDVAEFVGRDVVDGVGCYRARVEHDVAGELAVEECFDAKVEVGLGHPHIEIGTMRVD